MAHSGFFCTQFLLNQNCNRGQTCIFQHVSRGDVSLSEPIPNGSEFVEGVPQRTPACPRLQRAAAAPEPRTGRFSYSHLPCFFIVNGQRCPYENNCLYAHNNVQWDKRNCRDIMDRSNPTPSTSNMDRNSASSSTKADSEDESCLGATALIAPAYAMGQASEDYSSLEAENMRNLAELNIDAPEFFPQARFNSTTNSKKRLCPFAERDGLCKYPPGECTYLHGDMCDMCTRHALHPFNEELRKKHTQECIKRHERDMEIAFAVARSKEKVCGICFEIIMQKSSDEQRFGILPSCNHCFCLSCIRRWRQSKQFENKIIRSCPECRIASDFVCPSAYWVDTKEDKDKAIEKYKLALAKKDCKYFKQGRGHCPFGNKCFYRHCLANGKKIDVGPPPSTNHVRRPERDLIDFPAGVEILQRLLMLEHLQDGCPLEDFPRDMDIDDILEMFDISDILLSDTDESYWSD